MGQERRQYSREFKLDALKLVAQGRSVASVARGLGIHVNTFYGRPRSGSPRHARRCGSSCDSGTTLSRRPTTISAESSWTKPRATSRVCAGQASRSSRGVLANVGRRPRHTGDAGKPADSVEEAPRRAISCSTACLRQLGRAGGSRCLREPDPARGSR